MKRGTSPQFHENEKFAKFIMQTLNLEFVVYFEKSSFSWCVQLKGIYYYSLIKSSQLKKLRRIRTSYRFQDIQSYYMQCILLWFILLYDM